MSSWVPLDVITAAQRGGENARERLVTAIWPGCYRLAATVIGDSSLAQDAAQEASAIVYRKIRGLRDAGAFDTWLYRIVMREAIRMRRRNPSAFDVVDRPALPVDGTAAIDVWRALGELSSEQRDVVILFYFDDLSTEEIAKILGVLHGTVRTRLTRARERLRGILGDYSAQPLSLPKEQQYAL